MWPRLSKSESYVWSWEIGRIVNRKILYYLRKKQKIYIGMLNNHINYTFIDIIIIYHYIHCMHYLKRQKISKRDTLLRYFLFRSNWHFLYIRVEKLGLLGFIFHIGPTEPFVKEDYKKPKSLGIISDRTILPIAKILEKSGSF